MRPLASVLLSVIFMTGFVAPASANAPKQAWERAGVPDFKSFKDVRARKHAFFSYLLPRVTAENNRILKQREHLLSLSKKKTLTTKDKVWLKDLGKQYRLTEITGASWLREMLERVDVMPPSLALAQAAYESGWGTSRFARLGHNYFGQMCFARGCGFVPKKRNAGATRELAKFANVGEAVNSYIRNLNSHPTYEPLRELRARARKSGQEISGSKLANGLIKYSTRGQAYIEEVQGMIRVNKLAPFDARPTTATII